ncbi:AsmA family protein [Pseudomonas lopnurensis]|uniref:AsmA family protein n=1 Tax=Pseudomonas lopnurensis TaxID=1477517 RepID=UPI00187A554E|nr:AsmA family protein [Pseudomonas lopnurensis]MBE7375622.1 AsmA family protein [Pseudomonas lopnurensis]
MSRARGILLWFLAIVAVLAVALVVLLATFDWNLLRPTLNERVSDTLGRPFAIQGELDVRWQRDRELPGWRAWFPHPTLTAEDITLGNAEWGQAPYFIHLDSVAADLRPLALLGKRVSIPAITLGGPSAHIERLADGRANWTFENLAASDEAEEEKPSAWVLDIGTIGFDQGRVSLDDQVTRAEVKLDVTPLGEPMPYSQILGAAQGGGGEENELQGAATQDYAFAWNAEGRYGGQPVSGEGRVGGLLALQDAALPFPLQVDLRAGKTRVTVEGTLTDPRNLGALDLRLRLSGDSLGNLYPLIGVTLPDTGAYSTDGRLRADLQDPDGASFHYQGFNGRIGGSDIQGDLRYVAGEPRPRLSGELTSNQLRFSDLAPLIGADSEQSRQARGATSRQPADKALPVEEFRTERWRDMDADVRFVGKRIVHDEALPIQDLNAHVVLADGVLSLQPLSFGLAGGRLETDVHLDGQRTPLAGRVRLEARSLKLRQLFANVESMHKSLGELNGKADIQGTGNSVAALLGSANGELRLLMNDGTVSRGLMELAGLNVGNYLVGRLFGDEEVQINCAVLDLGMKNGLAEPRLFVLDTENAVINVTGQVNFRTENIDMNIVPRSKGIRIISLRSPLYVRGTLKSPRPGVHAGPLALRGAGMIVLGATVGPVAGLLALVAPSGGQADQCGPLLEQVKKLPAR